MLSRENRLINQKDFEEVHRRGIFFSFGEVLLKVKKNNLKKTRIGFSIGIKFSPKAVERNRVKRQLRGILRKNMQNINAGYDVIISIKKVVEKNIPTNILEQSLTTALKKAKLL
jgi:ribonuclease P protein component